MTFGIHYNAWPFAGTIQLEPFNLLFNVVRECATILVTTKEPLKATLGMMSSHSIPPTLCLTKRKLRLGKVNQHIQGHAA